jgi:hypothetical protein
MQWRKRSSNGIIERAKTSFFDLDPGGGCTTVGTRLFSHDALYFSHEKGWGADQNVSPSSSGHFDL